jgi:hypothetical protein
MRFGERVRDRGKAVERVRGEGCNLEFVGIRGMCDARVNREARAEAWGVLLENNIDRCGDAAGLWVVHAVIMGVRWVANHDATERFFAKFTAQLAGHLGEDDASEYAKLEASGADDEGV